MKVAILAAALLVCAVSVDAAEGAGTDKTLVAWVYPANLTQRGGSVLTIQAGDRFDAIVFGERSPGRWMAGSNFFRRTPNPGVQAKWPKETADAKTMVQIAVVYDGRDICIFRNGELYAEYEAENIDLLGADERVVVFGLRHIGQGSDTGTPFAGAIEDARIYGRALTQAEIASLQANEMRSVKTRIDPVAWWDFQGDKVVDRAGKFIHSAMTDGVKLEGGRLVLDGKGYLVAARTKEAATMATRKNNPRLPRPPYKPETPAWPAKPDAKWVTYHLAHPGPGNAWPGDPNCVFDYKGTYHLHYIYRNQTGFVFAHVSSDDLVRWKWHPTVLAPPTTGHGMFSGTGFYTKEGKPAIIYHGQGSGKNWIQFPTDDQFNGWTEPMAVLPKTADGKTPKMRHWDPDCWLNGDTYYALSGGGDPKFMKSKDLKNWTYLDALLHKDYPAKKLGIGRGEDISCANMFKIGDKWMLLCISHRLGCRYYLGDFQKDEKYLPDFHAMMSFGSNMFFAPESMLTRDGRRIMWAWLVKVPAAPTGMQCLPRELELPADGVLRIKPLRELAKLRYAEKTWEQIKVKDGSEFALKGLAGDAVELDVTFAAPAGECGLSLLADEGGKEGMSILAGAGRKTIKVGSVQAPLTLAKGEDLTLRVFIDKNLVEVFANDRQAVVFAHRHIRKNPSIRLLAKGGDAVVRSVKAWKMRSIYQPPSAGKAAKP